MTIAAMRRGLARCAGRLLRAATEGDVALGARQTTRAGLISAMGACDRLCAAARVPALRTFTSSPTWALSDQEYSSVFYPEPEAEVGEAAPSFSLPGGW